MANKSGHSWFYWLLVAFTASQIPLFVAVYTDFVLHPWAPENVYQSPGVRLVIALVQIPINIGISVLVIRRTPGNITGLLLLCWALTQASDSLRRDSPLLPYVALNVGWIALWLLPLFFPDGRMMPPFLERLVRWLVLAQIVSLTLWVFASPVFSGNPGYQAPITPVPNPVYIPVLNSTLGPFFEVINAIAVLSFLALIVPSIVWRVLRGEPVVRQQTKWLLWTFMVFPLVILPVVAAGITSRPVEQLTSLELVIRFLFSVFIALVPFIAVGNAILRHKLYDIDIIIRRTLIYTVLTTILGVVYFGGIVLTQQAFKALTGQTSDLAIVVSTLLIAALFAPLRRRVQDVIDWRLYRKKYDVEKVLADFQKNLRDEVDMETLKANLIGVFSETMQPDKIALWVRESPKPPTS